MWLKQCHKPPIWEWSIPPIYGEIGDGLFPFYPRYSIANRNWGWLCFLYFIFFLMIQPAFLQEKMLETRKKSTSSHWVNWHQFGMTHRCSRIGLKRHSEENLIWACLIFHRTSKCDDSSPFSGRNCHVGACPLWTKETFLDCKKIWFL